MNQLTYQPSMKSVDKCTIAAMTPQPNHQLTTWPTATCESPVREIFHNGSDLVNRAEASLFRHDCKFRVVEPSPGVTDYRCGDGGER